ncbi:mycothiol system anti-sigma-R factor [Timonella sp. A28]|uniref:mycothiol system anti-sigma-R factor n=1 Tax=Timonella sp. A28 TaxID=3442640 RepID=UPI003EB94D5D
MIEHTQEDTNDPVDSLLDTEDCKNVADHIYEYLDSEMTEEDATRMRAHVAKCSPCLAELDIDELIRKALKRSCAEQAPAHLRDKIRAQFLQRGA